MDAETEGFFGRTGLIHALGGRKWFIALPAEKEFDEPSLPYIVRITMGFRPDVGVECTAIEIRQRPGGPSVGAQRIRELPMRRLQNETLLSDAFLVSAENQEGQLWGWPATPEDAAHMEGIARRRGPGSLPVSDDHLRLALSIYEEAAEKAPRRRLVWTAEQLARRHNIKRKRSTIHAWIKKAQERSLDGEH